MSFTVVGNPNLTARVNELARELGPGFTLEELIGMCVNVSTKPVEINVSIPKPTKLTMVYTLGDGACFWNAIAAHIRHNFDPMFLVHFRSLVSQYQQLLHNSELEMFVPYLIAFNEASEAFSQGFIPQESEDQGLAGKDLLVIFMKVITAIHILENRRKYQYVLENITIEEFVEKQVLSYNYYADHIAIQAFSRTININVNIHQDGAETLLIKSDCNRVFTNVHVHLTREHYSLLLPQ